MQTPLILLIRLYRAIFCNLRNFLSQVFNNKTLLPVKGHFSVLQISLKSGNSMLMVSMSLAALTADMISSA